MRNIDVNETSKIIKRTLKTAFPDVKFAVRLSKYSGGCSIDAHWTSTCTKGQHWSTDGLAVPKNVKEWHFIGLEESRMGVDTKILLPAAVRIQDVADVMGALAGFPMEKRHFSNAGDGWSAGHTYGSPNVKLASIPNMVQCAFIYLHSGDDGKPMVDGTYEHQCMYHFEASPHGERLLMPRSTDFWIAIGKGLVEFFGGTLDYNDCDASDVDFERPEQTDIHAEDGEEWYSLQERKLAVKPLTKADLQATRKVASYT